MTERKHRPRNSGDAPCPKCGHVNTAHPPGKCDSCGWLNVSAKKRGMAPTIDSLHDGKTKIRNHKKKRREKALKAESKTPE